MFQLSEICDMVRVPPWLFGDSLNNAITEELDAKLANKILLDVGLCLSLYDLKSLGDSYIFPGDGGSHTKVTFRYVVFRPFMEEVLEGTIKSCNSDGIQVTLGFFDELFIRKDAMMTDARFDDAEGVWVWDYQMEDGTPHVLFMDIGAKIRVKVTEEVFTDTTPVNPNDSSKNKDSKSETDRQAAYIVYGAINDHGLGLSSWWISKPADEEEEEEEGEEEEEEEREEEERDGDGDADGRMEQS